MKQGETCRGPGPFSAQERRLIFREMIRGEIEAGLLRHSKRRELLSYAARLGITGDEATRLMAEVQHGLQPPRTLSPDELQHQLADAQRFNRAMAGVLLATFVAAAVNLLCIG